MASEPGQQEDGGSVPEEFRISHKRPQAVEHVDRAPAVLDDVTYSEEIAQRRVDEEKNTLALENEIENNLMDYTVAIEARAGELRGDPFDDSDVFEAITETSEKRGGFLWKNKKQHKKYIGAKWKNPTESGITKRSHLDFSNPESVIKYKLLFDTGEQLDSHPVLELEEFPKRSSTISLTWDRDSSRAVQEVFAHNTDITPLFALAERLGTRDNVLQYRLLIETQQPKVDSTSLRIILSQEDRVSDREEELQREYDSVLGWNTDSGDGSSLAMMRERNTKLEKIEKELSPLRDARFHSVSYDFNPGENAFLGTANNSSAPHEPIEASNFIKITKGILSEIPTTTREAAYDSSPILTLAMPGEAA